MSGPRAVPRAEAAATFRRVKPQLILRHLRSHPGQSRTSLAASIGLPKATVSKLVADLVAAGLVREGHVDRAGSVGRPRTTLQLDGRSICGLGVEITVDHLSAVALSLDGEIAADRRVPLDVTGSAVDDVLDAVAQLIERMTGELTGTGRTLAGVTVAVPGVIAATDGSVISAPNLHWRDVAVLSGLRRRLGEPGSPLALQNDARASAAAEHIIRAADGVDDLLYITGDVGIGGGLVSGGRLLPGSSGYAGEIGHLPLNPDPEQCACGRTGCWETLVGLAAFLRRAADPDDPVNDVGADLDARLREVRRRADGGDRRTRAALAATAAGLARGITQLVEILDPAMAVLGGYFTYFDDYLTEPVEQQVRDHVLAAERRAFVVRCSSLGLAAAARGAAHVALEAVFLDPTFAPG